MPGTPIGLYVHVPFCRVKCTYCDFNSYAGLENLFLPYVVALEEEAVCLSSLTHQPLTSIYVGGGTPSLLPPDLLKRLLAVLRDSFSITDDAEITCEANPGTLSLEYLETLRDAGVNRLSIGVQTFDPHELAMLGRIHTAGQARESVSQSRTAGFDNLSLDLIYGLPGQSLDTWRHTLSQAVMLEPEHLSLYALSLEPGTPLIGLVEQGNLPAPDADLAADMYEAAAEDLDRFGYAAYEISNWCRPNYECAHNLVYWRNQPYLGLGAGAHSSWGGRRWWNVPGVQTYVNSLTQAHQGEWPSPATQGGEIIDLPTAMGETMMLGLRLVREGVSDVRFRERFGVSLEEVFNDQIRELTQVGLITWESGILRLTRRGRLLGNQVFARFLPD